MLISNTTIKAAILISINQTSEGLSGEMSLNFSISKTEETLQS